MSAPSSNSNTSSSQGQNASMLAGHAQYAKGYVEETVGNLTGSAAWQESGKKDTEAGIEEMKAAGQQRAEPAPSSIGGRVEELAGKVAGCEGMEKEGGIRQEKSQ
ncbi:mismatched base pair and cruciform DNA recognition protein [Diplocarpon rosae]|nr:mismatched base pair and cruciform DNA recognition protein [Diplocarpon rosae]